MDLRSLESYEDYGRETCNGASQPFMLPTWAQFIPQIEIEMALTFHALKLLDQKHLTLMIPVHTPNYLRAMWH